MSFHGLPERVMNYFSFLARDVREILASLGARKFTDIIGRSELLEQLHGETGNTSGIPAHALVDTLEFLEEEIEEALESLRRIGAIRALKRGPWKDRVTMGEAFALKLRS